MFLFDQNLSPRLIDALRDLYPGSVHVQGAGLAEAPDDAVWNFAIERGLSIVTKDAGFRQRSFLEGQPPKVIWVAVGNCSTSTIETLLRDHKAEIDQFLQDEQSSFLSLS
ncbi:MAG: DUF5615 family PIN-like protein [Acidobacteriaceae bacterium]